MKFSQTSVLSPLHCLFSLQTTGLNLLPFWLLQRYCFSEDHDFLLDKWNECFQVEIPLDLSVESTSNLLLLESPFSLSSSYSVFFWSPFFLYSFCFLHQSHFFQNFILTLSILYTRMISFIFLKIIIKFLFSASLILQTNNLSKYWNHIIYSMTKT